MLAEYDRKKLEEARKLIVQVKAYTTYEQAADMMTSGNLVEEKDD